VEVVWRVGGGEGVWDDAALRVNYGAVRRGRHVFFFYFFFASIKKIWITLWLSRGTCTRTIQFLFFIKCVKIKLNSAIYRTILSAIGILVALDTP